LQFVIYRDGAATGEVILKGCRQLLFNIVKLQFVV
jgi:hypothetical protein